MNRRLPFPTHIDRLIHLADIHIPLEQRHEEYHQIFKKLESFLARFSPAQCAVILGGDLCHNKDILSPECIRSVVRCLRSISQNHWTIVIPGNHDGLVCNQDRLDTLSAIIDSHSLPHVRLLRDTGVYGLGNLRICTFSVFDPHPESTADWFRANGRDATGERYRYRSLAIAPDTSSGIMPIYPECEEERPLPGGDTLWIALYHGGVGSYSLSNGLCMTGALPLEVLKGYDAGLLGDIHKMQFLTPTIAYSGSLISQNFGETELEHGLIEWTFSADSPPIGRFHRIPNDYGGYYILRVLTPTEIEWYGETYNLEDHGTLPPIPPYAHVRLEISASIKGSVHSLLKKLRSWRPRAYFAQRRAPSAISPRCPPTPADAENPERPISRLPDGDGGLNWLKHGDVLLGEYLQHLLSLGRGRDLPPDRLDGLLAWFQEACRHHASEAVGIDGKKDRANRRWRLLSIEWDHLFGYGEGNRLDFEAMTPHRTIGIFGPNSSGKSSLIDAIGIAAFNQMTRWAHGVQIPPEVIHQKKDRAQCRFRFEVEGRQYRIDKKFRREKRTGKIRLEQTLEQFDPDTQTWKAIHGADRRKTDQIIRSMIGDMKNFTDMNASLQGGRDRSLLDMTQKDRKDWFYQHFDLEWVEQLQTDWDTRLKTTEKAITSATVSVDQLHTHLRPLEDLRTMLTDQCSLLERQEKEVHTHEGIVQAQRDQLLEDLGKCGDEDEIDRRIVAATLQLERISAEHRSICELRAACRSSLSDTTAIPIWSAEREAELDSCIAELAVSRAVVAQQHTDVPFRCPNTGVIFYPCPAGTCRRECGRLADSIDSINNHPPPPPSQSIDEWQRRCHAILSGFDEAVWSAPRHAMAWHDHELAAIIRHELETCPSEWTEPLEAERQRLLSETVPHDNSLMIRSVFRCPHMDVHHFPCPASPHACHPSCGDAAGVVSHHVEEPLLNTQNAWRAHADMILTRIRKEREGLDGTWMPPDHSTAWEDADLAESIQKDQDARLDTFHLDTLLELDLPHLITKQKSLKVVDDTIRAHEQELAVLVRDITHTQDEIERTRYMYNPNCEACRRNPYNQDIRRQGLDDLLNTQEMGHRRTVEILEKNRSKHRLLWEECLRMTSPIAPLNPVYDPTRLDMWIRRAVDARSAHAWLALYASYSQWARWEEYRRWQNNQDAYTQWCEEREQEEQRRLRQERLRMLTDHYRASQKNLQQRAWLDLFEEHAQIDRVRQYTAWVENRAAHAQWSENRRRGEEASSACPQLESRIHILEISRAQSRMVAQEQRIPELEAGIEAGRAEIRGLESQRSRVRQTRSRLDALRRQLDSQEITLQSLRDEKLQTRLRIRQGEERLAVLSQKQKDLQKAEEALSALEQERADLEFIRAVFRRDGLPLFLLRGILRRFEETLDGILSPFLGGDRHLRFDIETPSKRDTGSGTAGSSSVRIYVDSPDGPMNPFLGGMEGVMGSLATQCTINALTEKAHANVFILDESISALDRHHLQGLPQVFDFLEQQFEHVLVISHLPTVQDFVHSAFMTVNENGFRRIRPLT